MKPCIVPSTLLNGVFRFVVFRHRRGRKARSGREATERGKMPTPGRRDMIAAKESESWTTPSWKVCEELTTADAPSPGGESPPPPPPRRRLLPREGDARFCQTPPTNQQVNSPRPYDEPEKLPCHVGSPSSIISTPEWPSKAPLPQAINSRWLIVTEEHRMNALEERSSLAFGTPLCRARLPSAPPFAVSDALTTVICSVLVQGVSSGQLLAHS